MYYNALTMKGRGYLGGDVISSQGHVSERYVFNSNGVNQYVMFNSPISLLSTDTLSFKFKAPNSYPNTSSMLIAGNTTSGLFVFINSSGQYSDSFVNNINRTLDGLPINDGDQMPTDGEVHEISLGPSTFFNGNIIRSLGAQISDDGNNVSLFSGFPIFDLKVNNGSVYNFPVDDGPDSTVIRNTGTGPDATPINFLNSGWEKIPV